MEITPFAAIRAALAGIPDDPHTGTGWRNWRITTTNPPTELDSAEKVLRFAFPNLVKPKKPRKDAHQTRRKDHR